MEDQNSLLPKHRQTLNPKQVSTLRTLYKFRFATTYLIAKSQGRKDQSYTFRRFKILQEQGYIGSNYDNYYRIRGQHANYYLLPKGIQFLKGLPNSNPKVLHSLYRDRSASNQFISHCLNVFAIYAQFRRLNPNVFKFLSKTEMANYDYFPKLLPDAFLTPVDRESGKHEFILDCYEENVPFFTITRKITKYLEHYEASGWDVTGTDYPSFLLVCGSPALEKRLQKHICRTLDRLCQMEPVFYTTTYKALMSTTNSEDPIWSNVFEPEELTFLI